MSDYYSREDERHHRSDWFSDLQYLGDHDHEPEFAERGPSHRRAMLHASVSAVVAGASAAFFGWLGDSKHILAVAFVIGVVVFAGGYVIERVNHVEKQLRHFVWVMARIETSDDRRLKYLKRQILKSRRARRR
jgi:hypothetical protein